MSSHPEQQREFGPDLIRATAITLVLLAHTFPGGTLVPFVGIMRGFWGVWGVEIFFVLSGYLIGGILIKELNCGRLNNLGDTFSFWKRRWFRTLPNYYLFLCLLLLNARLSTGQLPTEWKDFFWFGQALAKPYPDFFAAAWSLAIEEWFYLLFPLVLLICARIFSSRLRAVLVTITIFLVVPVIYRSLISADVSWDAGIKRVTLPRLDAITYGVCLACIKIFRPALWNFIARLWPLGVVAVIGMYLHACCHEYFTGFDHSPSAFYRVFYFCFLSAGIALLFPKVAGMSKSSGWWGLAAQKMSLWSYSIYLSHVLFLGLITEGMRWVGFPLSVHGWGIVVHDGLVWLITIPCSAMVYRYFEKPCMDLRDKPVKSIFRRK